MHKEGSEEATMPQGSANAEPSSAQLTPSSGFHPGCPPPFQSLEAAENLQNAPPKAANGPQKSKSIDKPTQVKRDHRTSFADLMASVPGTPASSERPITAVVPVPVSHTVNNNMGSILHLQMHWQRLRKNHPPTDNHPFRAFLPIVELMIQLL